MFKRWSRDWSIRSIGLHWRRARHGSYPATNTGRRGELWLRKELTSGAGIKVARAVRTVAATSSSSAAVGWIAGFGAPSGSTANSAGPAVCLLARPAETGASPLRMARRPEGLRERACRKCARGRYKLGKKKAGRVKLNNVKEAAERKIGESSCSAEVDGNRQPLN